MFFAHIAFALELISLTIGALLILASHWSCQRKELSPDYTPISDQAALSEKNFKRHSAHHGFLKFIGYFTVILSFLALICTFISAWHYWANMKDYERNANWPSQGYNNEPAHYNGSHPAIPKPAGDHRDLPVAPNPLRTP